MTMGLIGVCHVIIKLITSPLRGFCCRFASVLCGVLSAPATEEVLQVIMPFITRGLEATKSPQLQAATYVTSGFIRGTQL